MAETDDGSLDPSSVAQALRPALSALAGLMPRATVVLVLMFAASASAQQPLYVPAPSGPEFLSRYDFHLSVDSLMPPKDTPEELADERFSWITHFGGSFDLVDLVFVRAGANIDYEAVQGSEYRPFDPNQGNYTLEAFVSARIGGGEIGPIFHHVSRHLSDRPKRDAVAWNELGARALRRIAVGPTTVDIDLEGGWAVQHSFVDYTWLGEANVLVRHPVSGRFGVFGQASGTFVGVTGDANRGTQTGGRVEGGVRVTGRGGVLEVYVGYENRVDAYPLDRVPQHWGLAGLRLLSR